jgi:uncharacterized protein (DUF952 family)
MTTVYKVLPNSEWQAAQLAGVFHGSAVDVGDGYIHFSTAEQLTETLRRHFAGLPDLMLLHVDTDAITPQSAWRWEPSRGGALFPHLYAPLPVSAVKRVDALPLDDSGAHALPQCL